WGSSSPRRPGTSLINPVRRAKPCRPLTCQSQINRPAKRSSRGRVKMNRSANQRMKSDRKSVEEGMQADAGYSSNMNQHRKDRGVFFQAEDGIRDFHVTGVQTCALPILGLEFTQTSRHQLDQPGAPREALQAAHLPEPDQPAGETQQPGPREDEPQREPADEV